MIPRHPLCDNDDCDYNEHGVWLHVAGCDANDPQLNHDFQERVQEAAANARPGTLAYSLARGYRR
jgi:hypothetical protein